MVLVHENIPWVSMDIPCDKGDRDLFHASTIITVEKGDKAEAKVWHSSWFNGTAAKKLIPMQK